MSASARLHGPRGFVLIQAVYLTGQLLSRPELRHWQLFTVHLGATAASVRWPSRVVWILPGLAALQCALTFPRTANHAFLAAAAALIAALTWREEAEHRWQLLGLPMVALAWSGVQKAVHGLWSNGQTLAFLMLSREDVGLAARPWLSDELAESLGSLSVSTAGAGPFQLTGAWVLASNATWILELATPALLWAAPLRARAWYLLIAVSWGFQWLAHEWEFALLLTHLCLVAAPAGAQAIGRAAVAAGILGLALLRSGTVQLSVAWWS